jgi:outer membrane protein insertion porin family
MKPFNVSKINDRFLLGGPTTIRGFEMWGVGPRVQGYAYGGEVYWAAGLHLFSPLPYLKGQLFQRIRIHGFLNAGNLIQYSERQWEDITNVLSCVEHLLPLRNLIKDTRASIGIGLHCRLGVAQIEINYALPLIAQSTDW